MADAIDEGKAPISNNLFLIMILEVTSYKVPKETVNFYVALTKEKWKK